MSTPYLVMEYAPLGTLRHLYPRGTPMPLPKVVSYIKQVAEALQYAHDHVPVVVHHDVKPENMLVKKPDEVVLSDFGIGVTGHNTHDLRIQIQEIAEKVARKEQVTIPGTAAYLAPERLQGFAQRASDQYSLAIVAYEWLCGHPPFDGNDLELCNKHLNTPPPSLSQNFSHIPQDVDQVILKALSKQPADRYKSVWDFALTLERAIQDSLQPTRVKVPAPPWALTPTPVKPSRSSFSRQQLSTMDSGAVEIFCCYAPKDQGFLDELRKHLMPLQRQGIIATWSNLDISPGANFEEEHSNYLNSAHLLLLLVSPDFLASDFCWGEEMMQAIEQHQQGKAIVIPIILRPVYWQETPFAHLQALPRNTQPISTSINFDEAWLGIVHEIKRAIEVLKRKSALPQRKSQSASRQATHGEAHAVKAAPLFSPDLTAWCPHCVNQFYVGDCDIVSQVTPGKILRSAPALTEWRQPARKNVVSLTTPEYLRELACRRCPYCGYLLPFNIELAKNISIAIVGETFSGKSHYLTSVIYELKERWLPENKKSASLTCLTPNIEQEYYSECFIPVFRNKQAISPTSTAIEYNRPPLIYEIKFKSSSGHAPKRVNLIFYDGSGEDYAMRERMVLFARHVIYTSAIIFLIDPTMIPEVYKQLPAYLQKRYVTGRGPSSVAKSTVQLLERFHGSQTETFLRSLPVAITLSKADLFRHVAVVAPKHGFLSHSLCEHQPDLQEIKAIDTEVRDLLARNKERSLLRLSQRFPIVSFFATSATGCAPNDKGMYPFIDPCRCLDPILWILHQLGALLVDTS